MILSCSRRTDIPAFYGDRFFNRMREGFVQVRNPMNPKQVRQVSLAPADVDCIVFWTKNPAPMLDRVHLLKDYPFYFQFTLTPYGKDIEPNVPSKAEMIDTFLRLSDKVGAERMIWRYDPIFLSKAVSVAYHMDRFGEMARRLSGSAEKCVISFMDMYRHIQSRIKDLSARPPEQTEMVLLAEKFAGMAKSCGLKVETCAEQIDLADVGIAHGKCIDDRLISKLTGEKLNIAKDKYQRELCGCAASVDIGEYNTCGHLCTYCYANVSRKKIEENQSLHHDRSPFLTGGIDDR